MLSLKLYVSYLNTKDKSILAKTRKPPFDSTLGFRSPDYMRIVDGMVSEFDAAYAGEKSDADAADAVRKLIKDKFSLNWLFQMDDKTGKAIRPTTFKESIQAVYELFKNEKDPMPEIFAFVEKMMEAYRESRDESRMREDDYVRDLAEKWNDDYLKVR